MTKKSKKRLLAVGFMFVSTAVALLLCEFVARLAFDRVDYLSPVLVRDDVLGIRLPGGSGGHDKWGFRNSSVPATAQIVAIGDSHTYGNCAKMREAWPHLLGQLTGKSVYNLGMGGYGPNQYYHLLQAKALGLKPRTVICGLYMGDDFDNAYRITYGLSHWAPLRRGGMEQVDPDIWEKQDSASVGALKRGRVWLSQHSVLYRFVVHGLLAGLKGRYQVKNAAQIYPSAAALVLPEKNIEEAFLPSGLLRGLDQQQPGVREGTRLTLGLLQEMNSICASNRVQFFVAVIPTKETVYARYLEHNSTLPMRDVLDSVIANERVARLELFRSLRRENISFIDLLPAMEKAIENGKIYTPGATDMHPNKNGYRVMAEAISQALTTMN